MPDNVSPTAVIEETVDELRQQVAEQELALKNKRAEREARRQQRQLDLAEANDSSSPNDDARESSSSPTAQRFLGWQLAVLSPRPSLKDEIEQARVALAAQAAAAKAQARAHSGGSVAKIVAGAEAELARTALEEANATLERMRAAQAEAEEQLPGWLNDAEADLRIVSTPSPCDDDDDDNIDDGNRPAAPWAEFLSSPKKEEDEEELPGWLNEAESDLRTPGGGGGIGGGGEEEKDELPGWLGEAESELRTPGRAAAASGGASSSLAERDERIATAEAERDAALAARDAAVSGMVQREEEFSNARQLAATAAMECAKARAERDAAARAHQAQRAEQQEKLTQVAKALEEREAALEAGEKRVDAARRLLASSMAERNTAREEALQVREEAKGAASELEQELTVRAEALATIRREKEETEAKAAAAAADAEAEAEGALLARSAILQGLARAGGGRRL